jgi:DNA-binding transcriptional LysR family regulator
MTITFDEHFSLHDPRMTEFAPIELRMLRAFEAVASAGSVSSAALVLGLTQSAVSQSLLQLEQVVGAKLLDRSQRPMRLTAAGLRLRHHSRKIFDEIGQLTAGIREQQGFQRVRVGMIDSFAAAVGMPIMRLFGTHITRLWAGLAMDQAELLSSRELDIIFTSEPSEDLDGLVRRELFTERYVVVTPAAYLAELQTLDLKRLSSDLTLIRFGARSNFQASIERYLRRRNILPDRQIEIDAGDVVMAMVAAGMGWTIATPTVILQYSSHLPSVRVAQIEGPSLERHIFQLSRVGEVETMAAALHEATLNILRDEVLPKVRKLSSLSSIEIA